MTGEQDVWLDIWRRFLAELDEQGRLDWEETFADGLSPASGQTPQEAQTADLRQSR